MSTSFIRMVASMPPTETVACPLSSSVLSWQDRHMVVEVGDLSAWFGFARDDQRFGYLRLSELKRSLTEARVLDALLDSLDVPGKRPHLQRLSPVEKVEAILEHVDSLISTRHSAYFDQRGGDVIAAALWRSDLSNRTVLKSMFSNTSRESDLLAPVAAWLEELGFAAHAEIPMGRKRTDLVAHRQGGWLGLKPSLLMAIELKNDVKEFERAIDQMSTYREYADEVYLAASPAMAMEYLDAHFEAHSTKRWDQGVLDRKLEALGFGFLLVEGRTVSVHLQAASNSPSVERRHDTVELLTERTRVRSKLR